MSPELLLAGAIGVALALYFLFGGADFGGGVWDLLASGPRAAAQRRAIAAAIGPVWEANHVWLILVVVILFTGFPPAFAAISVALHVPLTLFLIGVVLRGSAFAFRVARHVGPPRTAALRPGVLDGEHHRARAARDDRRRAGVRQHPRAGRPRDERVLRALARALPARRRRVRAGAVRAAGGDVPHRRDVATRRCARTSAVGRWPRPSPSA